MLPSTLSAIPNAVAGPSNLSAPNLAPSAPSQPTPLPTQNQRSLKTVSSSSPRYPQRQRQQALPSTALPGDPNPGIKTRLAARASQPLKKGSLKFKINTNVAKTGLYKILMGDYDRSLDENPDEPIMFEEQFILRVPEEVADGDQAAGIQGLAELVNAKKDIPGVSLKFKGQ